MSGGAAQDPSDRLRNYDFDFWAWPVDFAAKKGDGNVVKNLSNPLQLPADIVAWVCMKVFGRALVYPGSMQIINSLMG